MKLVKIIDSNIKGKRYTAIFETKDGKTKKTHFGSSNHENFTIHGDEERKKRYLDRHRKNENWDEPMTAGALSRWILWNKKTLRESIKDYKKRFNM